MPKEVEALRTSLDSRLSALEKALADPKQHGSLETLILELARVATQEASATARHAVLDAQKVGQQAVAAARSEAAAALEAQKVEAAALRQVIDGAKLALKQAEAALKEQRSDHDAAIEAERASAAAVVQASSELEATLDAARDELSTLRRELEATRRELDSARGERDSTQRDFDAVRRELESVRQDSDARTQMLSHSQTEQGEALRTAQDAARNAEARLEEAIRERDAAQSERGELERQLEEAENALRESDAVKRELQAAHEARDAAEVLDAARHPGRHSEPDPEHELDVETVVDLTSITEEEERQLAIEQRTRALELALRDAEARAESAELELARHRRPPFSPHAEPAGASPAPAPEAAEQFRGPARGARRVAFKADIAVQIDGNPGKLVDLSMTGAQVLTPAAINPNRLVTVTLPLGDSAMVCKAKVAWSRLEPRSGQLWYRAGVQFTNVDQGALETFFSMHQT
jgi:DNA repair exonuclease SbcCD ATPase subunit